jgi:catalase
MNIPSLTRYFIAVSVATTLTTLSSHAQTEGQTHSPAELVDSLHTAFGQHHARAVHAKGVILEGEFTPDAHGHELTKAAHFQAQKSKVTVRFSDFTGVPDIPDNSPLANPRGMALRFQLPDGSHTDLVTHSFNGFPAANTDTFRELMLAIGASGPDAPKPTPLDKFLDSHPVTKTFLTTQKTPASFATISYFGINSFKFTNAKGESHFVRYQIVPEKEELITDAQRGKSSPTYLMDEIKTRVASHPITFEMFAQLAESGDKIDDPSIAWPDTRKRVRLGKITVSKLSANTPEEDKALVFIPNHLPDGIQTADPMLDFRSKAYPISKAERQ